MIFTIALAGFIAAADTDSSYDATLDAQFKCPQELPSREAYVQDLVNWMGLAKRRHPDWTNERLANARHDMFVKHHCPEPSSQP